MARRSSAREDRFFVNPISNINLDTKGIAFRSQTVNTSVRNLVLISSGQSNMTSIATSSYTPTNGSVLDNLNIYDGAIYAAADPLIGCGWTRINGAPYLGTGHPMLRLADSFVTAGLFDRVINVPLSPGGSIVANHEPGGPYGLLIPVAIRRLAALGITEATTNVRIVVLWGQGENDNTSGTSQSAYTASLNNVIAASRTEGFNGLWFVAKQSWISGAAASAITNAQAAVVNHGANVWAGPDADALTGNNCSAAACRVADNTHWSDAGSASYAAAWRTAMALYGAPFA